MINLQQLKYVQKKKESKHQTVANVEIEYK